jgi:hypothetical protein
LFQKTPENASLIGNRSRIDPDGLAPPLQI